MNLISIEVEKIPLENRDRFFNAAKEIILTEEQYHELSPYLNRGLGDTIAKVLHPIAKGIDSIIGTELANCGGCTDRQEDWNIRFPS